jgi:hypothetical protein
MAEVTRGREARKSEIRVEREIDGDGWLVLRRQHGWLHGSLAAANKDAKEIGRIEVSA